MGATVDIHGPSKRVLLLASNPATSSQTGWPVGFWWAELTHPYWEFVEAERFFESFPHEDSRVVLPPVIGPCHCAYDLDGLHALLAEAFVVQGVRRALEVGVGQEGLHRPRVPANRESSRD